ncbi:MAG: hypothetical protein GY867_11935 [bacterium]|nr:hypothetical protein [bacterium]
MNISSFSFEGWKLASTATLMALTLCIVVTSGCSEAPKGPLEVLQTEREYRGWKIYSLDRVNILYPEGHPQEELFETIAGGYQVAADQMTHRLGMPPFVDTLNVVFYTGFGQGRDLTAKHWPYVEDGVIHYWKPSLPGVTLSDFMVQRWSSTWPSRDLFHHGMRTLFDFSGRNYHDRTAQLQDSNLYVPLGNLAVAPKFVSDSERVQSAEAASLVAYILAAHGPGKFKLLYEAQGPFDSIIDEHLGLGVDSLESGWLDYVDENKWGGRDAER